MAAFFTSFAELAASLGVVSKSKKKLRKALPESAFVAVKEEAGKPAALVWIAVNDQEANKKAGLDGSAIVPLENIVEDTGLEAEVVIGAVIRLAKAGLISKITPLGIAA